MLGCRCNLTSNFWTLPSTLDLVESFLKVTCQLVWTVFHWIPGRELLCSRWILQLELLLMPFQPLAKIGVSQRTTGNWWRMMITSGGNNASSTWAASSTLSELTTCWAGSESGRCQQTALKVMEDLVDSTQHNHLSLIIFWKNKVCGTVRGCVSHGTQFSALELLWNKLTLISSCSTTWLSWKMDFWSWTKLKLRATSYSKKW